MKILIVANNCLWTSWPAKIQAIKDFYAPLCELEIDVFDTTFGDIPFKDYPGIVTQFGPAGASDTQGVDTQIDQDWYERYIVPMAAGYDIVVFQFGDAIKPANTPLGLKFGQLKGVWCVETFINDEYSHYFLPNGNGGESDLGETVTLIIEHEIAHCLYAISGQPDRTHEFFYSQNFARVLTDIKLPTHGVLIGLYQQLVAVLEAELGIIKQQKSSADMQNNASSNTTNILPTTPLFPPKILAWAKAIAVGEGAAPASNNAGNLKFSSLTRSWGATQGRAATDGGYLCQFATPEAGNTALCNFLMLGAENELIAFHAPGARTLGGFTKIYAGNPPQGYIDGIAKAIGEPETGQISTFLA